MSNERYFVIHMPNSDPSVRMYTRDGLIRLLAADGVTEGEIFTGLPEQSDPNYWDGKMLIIKGTVAKVTPPGDWRIE